MRLQSVNISLPKEIIHNGHRLSTGIFKAPVSNPVQVFQNHLEGDGQADLVHHGGEYKAIYAYSLNYYQHWSEILHSNKRIPYGWFGENLTVEGLDEELCCIGDQWQISDVILTITQPRVPCYKLGIVFNNPKAPNLLRCSGSTGVYLKVLKEGIIQSGDKIELLCQGKGKVPTRALFNAVFRPLSHEGAYIMEKALEVPELSPNWRKRVETRLAVYMSEVNCE